MTGTSSRLGNLPVESSSFVGRRGELADVKRLLSVGRLVTITGFGGVGKTRLALRAASELQRDFPDGVWVAELGAVSDPGLVTQTVLDALGIRDRSTRAPSVVLSEFVAKRRLLLVIDNAEHVIDSVAVLAHNLLSTSADLRILTTSRQPLCITAEHVYTLAPLSLPEPDQPIPTGSAEAYGAVLLFRDRAVAAQPDFKITAANEAAVVRLCQELDGVPLAIELAAVRLRALTVTELLARLDDRYRILTGGSRTALQRHQTLRATVDWSFDLCSAEEKSIWARLSVFVGGFTLPAAEAVCSDMDMGVEHVLDLIAALVDKSIIIKDDKSGRTRYRMLATIREYGRDRLRESELLHASQLRFVAWYAQLVDQANADWASPRQLGWFHTLSAEHANLRAALEYCLADPDHRNIGLRMAGGLWPYWIPAGFLAEGARWLDRFLSSDSQTTAIQGRALWVRSLIAVEQGDPTAAAANAAECRALASALNDQKLAAHAAELSGFVAFMGGDMQQMEKHLKAAASLFEATEGDKGTLAVLTLVGLGCSLSFQSLTKEAISALEQSLATTTITGDLWSRSWAQIFLGLAHLLAGDALIAMEQLSAALRIKREFDDTFGIAVGIELIAWCLVETGEAERAARFLGALGNMWPTIGVPLLSSPQLSELHTIYLDRITGQIGATTLASQLAQGAEISISELVELAVTGISQEEPRSTGDTSGGLTSRQLEIADLVAAGLSNKQIAARLFISPRTAEGHVERILSRLELTSRTQLAAWVVANRPSRASH
ncbi:LuxR C-terminal-related transcriptional regulator [Mycobacterium sp. CVI_P3]|uniref:LuxR C-terminal-related transcriptional regulator n=1 Tax=Mycobacterium pinniadriaticum TaxID=2994102 RepID=A0ABT3SMU4_9MYCO|nr:LuxR C-terminal-related transcriptional regulator [Mycobacterium pinniadriaticum]MCX2934425.1 LuxR C-terminal-related transcriptional regulator [Mycobacterium pinniadriaticum]MCX2940848.1 LuxR C-terminal-related transcriptional regulator [Mycobacterium pinniadriaticum]